MSAKSNLGTAVLVVFVVAMSPLLLYLVPQSVGGDVALTVLSGSMSPTFNPGDFIVDKRFQKGEPLEVGMIVTFREGRNLVTHRIIAIKEDTGVRQVFTQGDANQAADPVPQTDSNIVGIYLFHVPYYGHVANFVSAPLGRVLFIIIPSLLIIAIEGRKVLQYLRKGSEQPPAAATPSPPPPPPRPTATPVAPRPTQQHTPAPPTGPPAGPRTNFKVVRR